MLKVEMFIAGNKMVNLSSFPSTDMIWVIHFRESMFEKVVTVHVHKTIYGRFHERIFNIYLFS